MPEIRFAADTHPELVRQVRVWLESTTAERSVADVVEASAELTKDALRLIAGAAPSPIAQSDLVAELTKLGHQATDAARDATLAGLDGLAAVTDGRLVKKVGEEGAKAAYEMNQATARQILQSLFGRRPQGEGPSRSPSVPWPVASMLSTREDAWPT